MASRVAVTLGAVILLVVLWLLLAPTPVEPVAWQPPAAPALTGLYAPNQALAAAEQVFGDVGEGPEATAVGPQGEIYAGMVDGRVVSIPSTGSPQTLVNTGGRPMGIKRALNGTLLVCDAVKGLLAISATGEITVLASGHGGKPFVFADDLDLGEDGTIYFTDASQRFGVFEYAKDILEHGSTGRLLAWDPKTQQTRVLMDGLAFANGVALNTDQSFIAVTETGAYRVHRYWLKGPKAGSHDILIDNLPGFPDNVTWSATRKVFWVALFAPRNPLLDSVAAYPALRKAVSRLPEFLQPKAARYGWVLGISEDGTVQHNLQDPDGAYSPVTSAVEHDGHLVLGSLTARGVARLKLR